MKDIFHFEFPFKVTDYADHRAKMALQNFEQILFAKVKGTLMRS